MMNISLIENIRSSLTHIHAFHLSVLLIQLILKVKIKLKLKLSSDRLVIIAKWLLKIARLACANKTKESITSQTIGSWDFWRVAGSAFNRNKSAVPPLFRNPELLCSTSDKTKFQVRIQRIKIDCWLIVNGCGGTFLQSLCLLRSERLYIMTSYQVIQGRSCLG